MSKDKEIQAQLDAIRPVYDDIQQMRARWEDLQTIKTARDDYESLIVTESSERDDLKTRRDELDAKWRRLALLMETTEVLAVGEFKPWKTMFSSRGPMLPRPVPPHPPPNQEAVLAARRRFKKFANRWAYSLHLSTAVLKNINCIADDVDRPLGEALALLDWSVFQVHTRRESNKDHIGRLTEWGETLIEYHDWLVGEIDTLETRFRRSMDIWKRWRERNQGSEGQARWETFIAETRRALQAEITDLKSEITDLETRLHNVGGRL
jgi:hypothetical protein